jgi:hypothetical protein
MKDDDIVLLGFSLSLSLSLSLWCAIRLWKTVGRDEHGPFPLITLEVDY